MPCMPTPTRWTADLETGIPSIDREHRELVEVVDHLRAAAAAGDEQAQVSHALDAFRAHTMQHFPGEEREMAAHRYPGLDKHAASHRSLSELVVALVVKQNSGQTVLYSEVDELAKALYRHILLDDKPFADFVRKKG